MANSHNPQKKLIETLWHRINQAIIDSDEVRTAMISLKKAHQLDAVKDYNLMLDVDKLIEEMLYRDPVSEAEMENEFSAELLNRDYEMKPNPKNQNQLVDGKILSPNELCFQEYLASQFDETLWMKKTGIRF